MEALPKNTGLISFMSSVLLIGVYASSITLKEKEAIFPKRLLWGFIFISWYLLFQFVKDINTILPILFTMGLMTIFELFFIKYNMFIIKEDVVKKMKLISSQKMGQDENLKMLQILKPLLDICSLNEKYINNHTERISTMNMNLIISFLLLMMIILVPKLKFQTFINTLISLISILFIFLVYYANITKDYLKYDLKYTVDPKKLKNLANIKGPKTDELHLVSTFNKEKQGMKIFTGITYEEKYSKDLKESPEVYLHDGFDLKQFETDGTFKNDDGYLSFSSGSGWYKKFKNLKLNYEETKENAKKFVLHKLKKPLYPNELYKPSQLDNRLFDISGPFIITNEEQTHVLNGYFDMISFYHALPKWRNDLDEYNERFQQDDPKLVVQEFLENEKLYIGTKNGVRELKDARFYSFYIFKKRKITELFTEMKEIKTLLDSLKDDFKISNFQNLTNVLKDDFSVNTISKNEYTLVGNNGYGTGDYFDGDCKTFCDSDDSCKGFTQLGSGCWKITDFNDKNQVYGTESEPFGSDLIYKKSKSQKAELEFESRSTGLETTIQNIPDFEKNFENAEVIKANIDTMKKVKKT